MNWLSCYMIPSDNLDTRRRAFSSGGQVCERATAEIAEHCARVERLTGRYPQSLRTEFFFDQSLQMLGDRRVIETLDDLVEKAGDYEPLSNFCGDTAGVQVKQ